MESPFTLGILTTLWQRDHVERVVMSYYAGLQIEGVRLVLLAVGSEGMMSQARAESCGWEYLEHANKPLAAKHAAGARALMGRVDAIMVVGSDDLVDVRAIEVAVAACRSGSLVHTQEGLHTLELATGAIQECTGALTGAGAVYSREVLDLCEWSPWGSSGDDGLDTLAYRNVWRPAGDRWTRGRGPVLDIKSDVNMWPWSHYTPASHPVPDAGAWLDSHFPGIKNRLNHVSDPEL